MVALTVAIVVARTSPAAAHVQASVDENNRYLKLSPMGDRVRLAYTVFLGERPGATLRKRIDRNRDGHLDDGEAAAYGKEIAALVHPAVRVTLDGKPAKIAWTTLDVGLGTPSVAAGAFSVDLVGWVCTGGGAAQRLVLVDTVELDKPGETEVRLEDGPGVSFGDRRIGDKAFDTLETTWTGAGGPLTTGLDVAWTVSDAAPRPADGRCSSGAETTDAPRWWLWGVALVALAAVAAAIYRRYRNVKG